MKRASVVLLALSACLSFQQAYELCLGRDGCISDAGRSDAGFDGGPPCPDPDETRCGGAACVKLQANSYACGRCDRSCLGGPCLNGRCEPEDVMTPLVEPHQLVAWPGSVLWSEGDPGPTCPPEAGGRLSRGAAAPIRIGNFCTTAIGISANHVYVAGGGAIEAYTSNGLFVRRHARAPGTTIGGLAVAGAKVYFTAGPPAGVYESGEGLGSGVTTLRMVAYDAGPLVAAPDALWVAINDSSPEVRRLAYDGGFDDRVQLLNGSIKLAHGGGRVFVAVNKSDGKVLSYPYGGSSATELAGTGGATAIAASDVAVYWAEDLRNGTSLIHVLRHGGADETLSVEMGEVRDIAADGTWVHWLLRRGDGGVLRRVAE